MEWLCILNGKYLSDYIDKWAYSSFGEREWAELSKVLPYEIFEDKQYFLRYLPFYIKHYQDVLPIDQKLKQLVDRLQSTNYLFSSFLNAFRQLHENLVHNPKQKGGLDFRVLRPLDYYSLLAIRAEVCLRYALEKDGSLKENASLISSGTLTKQDKLDSLNKYIVELAKQKSISDHVIKYFESNKLTQLRDTPENPISNIMEIRDELWSEKETHLVHAFLCCSLARNYFAHHTYLDKELIRDEKSAFMLTGIIVTVAVLLDNS